MSQRVLLLVCHVVVLLIGLSASSELDDSATSIAMAPLRDIELRDEPPGRSSVAFEQPQNGLWGAVRVVVSGDSSPVAMTLHGSEQGLVLTDDNHSDLATTTIHAGSGAPARVLGAFDETSVVVALTEEVGTLVGGSMVCRVAAKEHDRLALGVINLTSPVATAHFLQLNYTIRTTAIVTAQRHQSLVCLTVLDGAVSTGLVLDTRGQPRVRTWTASMSTVACHVAADHPGHSPTLRLVDDDVEVTVEHRSSTWRGPLGLAWVWMRSLTIMVADLAPFAVVIVIVGIFFPGHVH